MNKFLRLTWAGDIIFCVIHDTPSEQILLKCLMYGTYINTGAGEINSANLGTTYYEALRDTREMFSESSAAICEYENS